VSFLLTQYKLKSSGKKLQNFRILSKAKTDSDYSVEAQVDYFYAQHKPNPIPLTQHKVNQWTFWLGNES
jgi:hypothetical protein